MLFHQIITSLTRKPIATISLTLISALLFALVTFSYLGNRISSDAVKTIRIINPTRISIVNGSGTVPYGKKVEIEKKIVSEIEELETEAAVRSTNYSYVKSMVPGNIWSNEFIGATDIVISADRSLPPKSLLGFDPLKDYENDKYLNYVHLGELTYSDWGLIYQTMNLLSVSSKYPSFLSTGIISVKKGEFVTEAENTDDLLPAMVNIHSVHWENGHFVPFKVGDVFELYSFIIEDNVCKHVERYDFVVVGTYVVDTANTIINDSVIITTDDVIQKIQEDDILYSRKYDCTVLGENYYNELPVYSDSIEANLARNHANKKELKLMFAELEADSSDIDKLVSRIKEDINDQNIRIITDSTDIQKISGSIGVMESSFKTMKTMVISGSMAMFALLEYFYFRSKKDEMRIYRSLGEKSRMTILRWVLVNIIICSLAFPIGLSTGYGSIKRYQNKVIQEYKQTNMTELADNDEQAKSVLSNFELKLKTDDVVKIVVLCYGTVIGSSLLSVFINNKTEDNNNGLRGQI